MSGAKYFTNGVTTVTTGATKLFSSNLDAEVRGIAPGAGTLYIGNAGVTTTTGFPLTASVPLFFQGGDDRHSGLPNGEIWGIVTTGTLAVRTTEVQ